jgi:hypothetical protein
MMYAILDIRETWEVPAYRILWVHSLEELTDNQRDLFVKRCGSLEAALEWVKEHTGN